MKTMLTRTVLMMLAFAGFAAAQRFYTQSNIVPPAQPVWIYITTNWSVVQAPPIQCLCIITDLYTPIRCSVDDPSCVSGSEEQQFTAVNPSTTFEIGTPGPCSEAVSVTGESYLTSIPDLSYQTPLPGIGSKIELNWIYVGLYGGYTVYMRRDQYESYCDLSVVEINPQLAPAPC